jgi:hypothetical protein
MQQKIGERPGSQGNWIILSQWLHNTTVRQNSSHNYQVVAFRRDRPWGEEERAYRLFESTPLVKELGLQSSYGRRSKSLSPSALSVERLPNKGDRTVRGTFASNVAAPQKLGGGTLDSSDSSSFTLPKLRLVKALRNQELEQANTAVPDQEASEDRTQQLGTSLLYLGPVTDQAKVSGVINYLDQACVGLSLRVAMLDTDGHIVNSTESAYRHTPQKITKFDLSVRGQDSAYLLLNILNYDQNDLVNSCTLQINPLNVLNPKS